jgi:hypothetical protein
MMQAREVLLRKLAAITQWDAFGCPFSAGESWLESRNTIYRLRDGVCFDVGSRDPKKSARAKAVLGMRLVGWVSANGTVFSREWRAGACAILWRADGEGEDAAMAMTSPTTSYSAGRSSGHLQALRDQAPPTDSQTFRRREESANAQPEENARAQLPSASSLSR